MRFSKEHPEKTESGNISPGSEAYNISPIDGSESVKIRLSSRRQKIAYQYQSKK